MTTSIKLRSASRRDDVLQRPGLDYECSQSEDGKTLSFTARVVQDSGDKYEATVEFEGCTGATVAEALERLGRWCARAAEALAEADDMPSIPA